MVELAPLEFRRTRLDWSRPYLLGVLNVTPDSFSDGGAFFDQGEAVRQGRAMVAEGVDLLDIGGESTRPGAVPVGAEEELRRLLPVVRALAELVTVSVDTYKAEVADRALASGAEIINDVSGGTLDSALLSVVARHRGCVILGHLRGTPATMTAFAEYRDVVQEVVHELRQRRDAALAVGIERAKVWIDPGLGFAKTAEHNVELLARLDELRTLGHPIVIGASRKSFLGTLTGRSVGEREWGGAAANAAAVLAGANVLRVHGVAAQRDAAKVADAIRRKRRVAQ